MNLGIFGSKKIFGLAEDLIGLAFKRADNGIANVVINDGIYSSCIPFAVQEIGKS